jgi:DUF1680 family protein
MYAGEAFGPDYYLPNRVCYNETCAAIALVMWNWRMLQLAGEARFADVMERTLYNGVLCGLSLDGMEFFYTNPLEHDGGEGLTPHHRGTHRRTTLHWDRTACCPPNIARTLAAVPGMLYGRTDDAVYVHHYAASDAEVVLAGTTVKLSQQTNYPWDGKIELGLAPEKATAFDLFLRIPAWARDAMITVNGRKAAEDVSPGSYCRLSRTWSADDTLSLEFPMPVERVTAHPRVANNAGCVALCRGPLVYCLEQTDHAEDIFRINLPREAVLDPRSAPDILDGMLVVRATAGLGPAVCALYERLADGRAASEPVELTAVPYFAWANREPGAVRVWIPES